MSRAALEPCGRGPTLTSSAFRISFGWDRCRLHGRCHNHTAAHSSWRICVPCCDVGENLDFIWELPGWGPAFLCHGNYQLCGRVGQNSKDRKKPLAFEILSAFTPALDLVVALHLSDKRPLNLPLRLPLWAQDLESCRIAPPSITHYPAFGAVSNRGREGVGYQFEYSWDGQDKPSDPEPRG